jgi:DNA invertase Pin-like site-specific DNA recombinase
MKLGYWVSTADQSLDLQLAALNESGCQRIFREKVSGAQRQRGELQRLLDQLRAGDTLVVWKLDRLARSTRDLLEIMEITHAAGARFDRFRSRGLIRNACRQDDPHGVRRDRRVRTRLDSRAHRRRQSHCQGQRRAVWASAKLNTEQRALALRLLREGRSAGEVAKTFRVHGVTIYRLAAAEAAITP